MLTCSVPRQKAAATTVKALCIHCAPAMRGSDLLGSVIAAAVPLLTSQGSLNAQFCEGCRGRAPGLICSW